MGVATARLQVPYSQAFMMVELRPSIRVKGGRGGSCAQLYSAGSSSSPAFYGSDDVQCWGHAPWVLLLIELFLLAYMLH